MPSHPVLALAIAGTVPYSLAPRASRELLETLRANCTRRHSVLVRVDDSGDKLPVAFDIKFERPERIWVPEKVMTIVECPGRASNAVFCIAALDSAEEPCVRLCALSIEAKPILGWARGRSRE